MYKITKNEAAQVRVFQSLLSTRIQRTLLIDKINSLDLFDLSLLLVKLLSKEEIKKINSKIL